MRHRGYVSQERKIKIFVWTLRRACLMLAKCIEELWPTEEQENKVVKEPVAHSG